VPGAQTVPTVGQRVVLCEEDPTDPQGKRYTGFAIWRAETVSTKLGLAPELAIRADVTIPERRMAMTWSLHRSPDKGVPASYTIETTFNLPADLHGGGIANVPGILMKQSEQARGTELAGLAVKVMNGYFVIGLSATRSAMSNSSETARGSIFRSSTPTGCARSSQWKRVRRATILSPRSLLHGKRNETERVSATRRHPDSGGCAYQLNSPAGKSGTGVGPDAEPPEVDLAYAHAAAAARSRARAGMIASPGNTQTPVPAATSHRSPTFYGLWSYSKDKQGSEGNLSQKGSAANWWMGRLATTCPPS
jgi:hypothetical protein